MPSKEKLYQELHFVQVQENSGGKFIYFIKLLLISHQTIFIIIFLIKLEAETNIWICLRTLNILRTHNFRIESRNGIIEIKLLTRLRLGLSRLRENEFNHSFQDTINPIRPCSSESKPTCSRCESFKFDYIDTCENIQTLITQLTINSYSVSNPKHKNRNSFS